MMDFWEMAGRGLATLFFLLVLGVLVLHGYKAFLIKFSSDLRKTQKISIVLAYLVQVTIIGSLAYFMTYKFFIHPVFLKKKKLRVEQEGGGTGNEPPTFSNVKNPSEAVLMRESDTIIEKRKIRSIRRT